jgi:hypothetical protein
MGSLTSKATTSSKDAVHASTSSKEITQTSARWEQSYSFDGGKTSRPNSIILHGRVNGRA